VYLSNLVDVRFVHDVRATSNALFDASLALFCHQPCNCGKQVSCDDERPILRLKPAALRFVRRLFGNS
jgi:hypothetical protein